MKKRNNRPRIDSNSREAKARRNVRLTARLTASPSDNTCQLPVSYLSYVEVERSAQLNSAWPPRPVTFCCYRLVWQQSSLWLSLS